MREILFRGKTTPKEIGEFNNTWVYGDLIKSKNKYYIHPQSNAVTVDNELGKIIVMHEVIPESIGQYINDCDQERTQIFEGDIVDIFKNDGGKHGTVVVIEKDYIVENGLGYRLPVGCNNCKVVGNMFDNPELVDNLTKRYLNNYWFRKGESK